MGRFLRALSRKRWVATVIVAVAFFGVEGVCAGQSPYPMTATPCDMGGTMMPESVPYQPTMCAPQGEWIQPPTSCPCPGPCPAAVYPCDPGMPMAAPAPAVVPFPDQVTTGPTKSWFPPSGHDGFFQGIDFIGDYLPRFNDESLGMSDLQLGANFGLPLITRETPLVVTPFFGVHYLDGPNSPDVPPRLYDAAVTFQHYRPLNNEWLLMFDVTLGEFTDDDSWGTGDAFRITGGGSAVYRTSDEWKWVLGAAYVDRINTQILPIVGFVYTPNDDAEYRLVFPAPKISWRLPWSDVPGRDERWAYVAGEFGGGRWAVQRVSGETDKLDITDWRVFVGLERKIIGGLSRRVELGYVFSRKLEYSSDHDEISLDPTLMLRVGLNY
jgi:Domain of unknown function (DUF6268)